MAEVHDMMDYLEEYAHLNHDDILLYLVQKQKEEMADEEDEEEQVQISEIQGKGEYSRIIQSSYCNLSFIDYKL